MAVEESRTFWLKSDALTPADQQFQFELCRKPAEQFGPVEIGHWWMRVTPLYGQRKHASEGAQGHNRREILRHYWAVVRHERAMDVRAAQERYLLASLVPRVRDQGSRITFADAFLNRPAKSARKEDHQNLEIMLRGSHGQRTDRDSFHERSWQALGRQEFPSGVEAVHERMTHELLDEPCAALQAGDVTGAQQTAAATWDRFMRTIGRRRGHLAEKAALDALSYEARAAFHQCYSVAWAVLIPLMEREERISIQTCAFLWLWHTDRVDSGTHVSLFHGHVFGLHPATGPFMQTATGRQLLGNWLANLESADALGELLNGLMIALFAYRERREAAAQNRENRHEHGVSDYEQVENEQVERRAGRRRRG